MAVVVRYHQNSQVVWASFQQDLVSWVAEVEEASYELQRLQHYLKSEMQALRAER